VPAIKVLSVIIRFSSLTLELTYEDIRGNLRSYILSSYQPTEYAKLMLAPINRPPPQIEG